MRTVTFAFISALWILFFTSAAIAQGETAVGFLTVTPGPQAFGIGGASAVIPSDDAIAPEANPAHLGLFSLTNLFSASTYTPRSEWLPEFQISGMSYGVSAVNVGYNLRPLLSLPFDLGIGLGYSRVSMDLGTFVITSPEGPEPIGSFQSRESADIFSLGLGIDYYVRLGVGFNFKNIDSKLAPAGAGTEQGTGEATQTATDFGALLDIPVLQIASQLSDQSFDVMPGITPFLDLSFGYVRANVGGEIVYIDPAQADPLPRTSTLGAGVKAGFAMKVRGSSWQLASFRLVHQADDILVTRYNNGAFSYRSGVGDIRFWDDVVIGKYNAAITSRRGWELQLGEFFAWREGFVERPNDDGYGTSGFSFSVGGVLKLLCVFDRPLQEDDSWFGFVIDHFDLQFHSAQQKAGRAVQLADSFQSLNLVVKGFSF